MSAGARRLAVTAKTRLPGWNRPLYSVSAQSYSCIYLSLHTTWADSISLAQDVEFLLAIFPSDVSCDGWTEFAVVDEFQARNVIVWCVDEKDSRSCFYQFVDGQLGSPCANTSSSRRFRWPDRTYDDIAASNIVIFARRWRYPTGMNDIFMLGDIIKSSSSRDFGKCLECGACALDGPYFRPGRHSFCNIVDKVEFQSGDCLNLERFSSGLSEDKLKREFVGYFNDDFLFTLARCHNRWFVQAIPRVSRSLFVVERETFSWTVLMFQTRQSTIRRCNTWQSDGAEEYHPQSMLW